ncbi:MAG: class A sortase [Lactobacillaceae bacterium]|jgi:LPXTG-site transpeptidase (sortase) family protein|nr:class A sortase [Lactobacillaceae bacterium]
MTNKQLKIAIVGLFTLALIFAVMPFARAGLSVANKTSTLSVRVANKMPKQIKAAENIEPMTLKNLINGRHDAAVGQVFIPSVGIEDNIYAALTNANLTFGAVTMFPERTPNDHNLVLLGHHLGYESLHFGKLSTIKPGAKVYVNYLNQYYKYQVTVKKLIKETDINQVKDTTTSMLSLVTCDRGTKTDKRILVQAELLSATKTKGAEFAKITAATDRKNRMNINHDLWRVVWRPVLILVGVYLLLVISALLIIKRVN